MNFTITRAKTLADLCRGVMFPGSESVLHSDFDNFLEIVISILILVPEKKFISARGVNILGLQLVLNDSDSTKKQNPNTSSRSLPDRP